MSEGEGKSVSSINKTENKIDEVSASHFALQIALQTMKERCQLLQQRLSAVEEENLRLRIENQNNSRKDMGSTFPISELEGKITKLSRQKFQLVDRISMVAKENNQLWTRLSRVTEANQSLGNHLSKISETLYRYPVGEVSENNEPDFTVPDSNSRLCSDGTKEESLEEISLKIIDTIRREKMVLEQQCEEMVELQTSAINVEECGFNLTANVDVMIANGCSVTEEKKEEDTDFEIVMEQDLRRIREKMKEEYKLLRDQQTGLHAAIASFNILITEKKNCKCKTVLLRDNQLESKVPEIKLGKDVSVVSATLTSTSCLDDIQKQLQGVAEPPVTELDTMVVAECRSENSLNKLKENIDNNIYKHVDDRICPICSKFYSHKEPFNEFHDHVVSHFMNDVQDDSIIQNFEVIT